MSATISALAQWRVTWTRNYDGKVNSVQCDDVDVATDLLCAVSYMFGSEGSYIEPVYDAPVDADDLPMQIILADVPITARTRPILCADCGERWSLAHDCRTNGEADVQSTRSEE